MIFGRVQKSVSTPVSPYGLSQLRGRIRQFVVLSQDLATSASSRPYPTIRPSTEKVHSSLVPESPPLDLPVFGSAHQLQSSHVESKPNVILQQGCHPPPVTVCIPKPHVSHPTNFFSLSPGLPTAAHYHRHHSSINLRPYPFAKPRTSLLSPIPRRPLHLLAARIQRKGWSAFLRLCWFRLFPLE